MYSNAEITELTFSGTEIVGRIKGHATEAIEKAHAISSALFGVNNRWRFYSIQYVPADEVDFASNSLILFRSRVV